MKKLFAYGKIKKVEKELVKYVKQEFNPLDGNIWAEISTVKVDLDTNFITMIARFGREHSEKYFTKEIEVSVIDGKVDFIVGQIIGVIIGKE